ncbi:MAG: TRC40/GET3/ArsA family transport-energizing ATPase [Nitrospirae bacterium]|nr:TRC40/GET3/ArsA family transport-energizing ATPase [Nitrospirota bacterium]
MTKYIFFSGKGGVGKTTMACATAIHYALHGRKTLIVTTDPASNLADVFEQEIGHKETPISGIGNLHAMEIDPDEATKEYQERIIGPFREIMPDDVITSLEENLSGPCTTEMAAFDRFIDFMGTDEYEIIIFDTAPTGHTIRLLELPVDWSKHIEESAQGSGQTCLGPVQSLQDSKDKYDRATSLLKDTERTDFIFVMRPEELSLYETLRASKELETIGINSGEIIINGILPEEVCEIEFFRKKYEAQQKIIKKTETAIEKIKRYMLLRDNEVKGIDALKGVAMELFKEGVEGQRFWIKKHKTEDTRLKTEKSILPSGKPDIEKLLLPSGGTKAIFFTGKGGVGKTTISCVTAVYTAQKGLKTLIVTTDPAAHIGEVFDVKINDESTKITENLFGVMIDQDKAFIEYKERIIEETRGKYSDDMLAAMEEELNSPCIAEMAAFDKFIRFIESSAYDVIVFDTAPTGHTLRLLDLPFDYAKQAEMMIDTTEGAKTKRETENRFQKIIELLRNPKQTVFCLVLYPESTPIIESYRAMIDLKNAGIETQLVVANMVLPEEVCVNDFFKNRLRMQMRYLREIQNKFNLPVLQFPMMQEEIKGLNQVIKAAVIF